jgi:hypothetical protein
MAMAGTVSSKRQRQLPTRTRAHTTRTRAHIQTTPFSWLWLSLFTLLLSVLLHLSLLSLVSSEVEVHEVQDGSARVGGTGGVLESTIDSKTAVRGESSTAVLESPPAVPGGVGGLCRSSEFYGGSWVENLNPVKSYICCGYEDLDHQVCVCVCVCMCVCVCVCVGS